MADNVATIQDNYPIPTYYYNVAIDGTNYVFQEVSGLSIEYETITYKHGQSYKDGYIMMPGQIAEVNLTLKRGIVRKDDYLYSWLGTVKLNTVEKRDVFITLLDNDESPVVSWNVYNVFPKKIDAPTFDASSNEVAIENLELMANRMEIVYL